LILECFVFVPVSWLVTNRCTVS